MYGRRDVQHPQPWAKVDRDGLSRAVASGQHIDFVTGARQGARNVCDIHILAPGISATERRRGRGVLTDQRDAQRGIH
jgi:hypothetical protein